MAKVIAVLWISMCIAACADDRPSRPLSPQMYDLLANPVPGPVPTVQPVFVMNPRRY